MLPIIITLGFLTCGIICGYLASRRGAPVVAWALAGLFLGPLGLLAYWLAGLAATCPVCGESIYRTAEVCRHCGATFPAQGRKKAETPHA